MFDVDLPWKFAEFMHHGCGFSVALLTRVLDFLHLPKDVHVFNSLFTQSISRQRLLNGTKQHTDAIVSPPPPPQLVGVLLTLKKRSRESWMERSGRVFFRRGRSIDRSLNCSLLVTTSPQLEPNIPNDKVPSLDPNQLRKC